MPKISTLTAVLELDQSDFKSGIDDSKRDLESLKEKADRVGGSLQSAGKTLTAGLTLPLAAMGAQAARTAGNFESEMNRSMSVMGDVSDEMEEKLEQRAIQVAETTTQSAQAAASAYYYLSSAGLDAQQSLEAMPTVAAFSEAAGNALNMADATDVATNVMSAYNMEASELSEVTDTLVKTTTNHNQTVGGMAAAFRNVAPAAASMGVELDELAALTGALGDQGIQGAESGTALASIMRRFAKDGGEAAKTLEELGVQTTDANGNLRPMTDIFADLQEKNLSAAESSAIFGEQMSAGNALLNTGADELEGYQDKIGDADGATNDMAEDMRSDFNAQVKVARDRLGTAGIAIGNELLPHLSVLVGMVSNGAQVFSNLSGRTQTAIVVTAGLAAVAGPAAIALGTLISNAFTLYGAMGTVAAGTSGAAGTISGALLPSSVAASGGLTGLATSALTAQVSIMGLAAPVWVVVAAIGALLSATALFAAAYASNWKGVKDHTEWAIGPITDGIDWFIEKLFGISDATGKVAGTFGDFVDWVIAKINNIPKIKLDSGDMADLDTSSTESGGETASDIMGSEDYGEQGKQAGQSYGSGFQSGLVEEIKPDEVESHLQKKLEEQQSEIPELENEVERLERLDEKGVLSESGQVKLSIRQDELEEAKSKISTLESQLESARNAEDITDVDESAVASVAQQDLKKEQERAEYIESVYSEMDGVEAPDSAAPSMSPEEMDEQSVEAMLAESQSGSGSGSQDDTLAKKFDQLLKKHDQLRTTVETLQLVVEMDLNSRELNNLIDSRSKAQAKEVINSTGP